MSSQVCFSLLDQRVNRDMARLCEERGVKLLAFGSAGRTLAPSGTTREELAGSARAVRRGDLIIFSGTTATLGNGVNGRAFGDIGRDQLVEVEAEAIAGDTYAHSKAPMVTL